MPRSSSAADPTTNGATTDPPADLVEKAEAVKVSLKNAIGQVNDLIAAAKAHKKTASAVNKTLSALQQLQHVA